MENLQILDASYFYFLKNGFIDCKWNKLVQQNTFDTIYLKDLGIIDEYNDNDYENILYDFALFFVKNAEYEYMIKRGYNSEFLKQKFVGSTHIFNDIILLKEFVDVLKQKYNTNLIKKVINFILNISLTVEKKFKDGNFITFPDIVGTKCKGIVFRSIGHFHNGEIRNIYKFFITNPGNFIYNSKILDLYDDIYLVEGVFDVLSLEECGIKNVISTSNIRVSNYVYNKIKNKNITLLFDNDRGGLVGLEEYYMKYHNNKVKYKQINYKNYKDIDEIRFHEKEKIIELYGK